MTIIERDTGIVVVDPLDLCRNGQVAIYLYYKNRGQKPVHAVIYTHSHVDHYGGVRGYCRRSRREIPSSSRSMPQKASWKPRWRRT